MIVLMMILSIKSFLFEVTSLEIEALASLRIVTMNPSDAVDLFLAHAGLNHTAERFRAAGYDSMQSLRFIDRTVMDHVRLTKAERKRLRKALEEFDRFLAMQQRIVSQLLWCVPQVAAAAAYTEVFDQRRWDPDPWPAADECDFPDKQMVFLVGCMRFFMLQESVADEIPDLARYTRHGDIGSLCADDLRAATQEKNLDDARLLVSGALLKLVDFRSEAGSDFLNDDRLISDALMFTEHLYLKALHHVQGSDRDAVSESYHEFTKCRCSLQCDVVHAMIKLRTTTLPPLRQALNGVVLLTCVKSAEEPLTIHTVQCGHTQPIADEVKQYIRSILLHCFRKTFADLPGARTLKQWLELQLFTQVRHGAKFSAAVC